MKMHLATALSLGALFVMAFFHHDALAQTGDLEAAIQDIAAEYPEATLAVAVRDDATGMRIDINADRTFHAASTMKTPIAIEVYRQAEAGAISLDDSLRVENSFRSIVDGSRYEIQSDSDDAIYERLGTNMTVRDLLYQSITVSSNLATNILIDHFTADAVQQTVEQLDAGGMQVLRGVEDLKAFEAGLSNATTAGALATLFHALMRGEAVSPAADRAIIDIHLDQQFADMIPAGLPETARVAHKTGSITEIHHDAGIVYPQEGEPYVLVVLTEGIADRDRSAELGAAVSRAVHNHLRP